MQLINKTNKIENLFINIIYNIKMLFLIKNLASKNKICVKLKTYNYINNIDAINITKTTKTIHPSLDEVRLLFVEFVANFKLVPMNELKILLPFLEFLRQGSNLRLAIFV